MHLPVFLSRSIFMSAVVSCLSGQMGCKPPADIQAPVVTLADRWEYEEIDNRTGKRLAIFTDAVSEILAPSMGSGQSNPIIMTQRSDGNGEGDFLPGWNPLRGDQLFNYPLTPGKKWKHRESARPPDTRMPYHKYEEVRMEGQVHVVGWEKIVVPAGRFQAMRIESEYEWWAREDTLHGKEQVTRWFAPEVKREVKVVRRIQAEGDELPFRDETMQLVSYQVTKTSDKPVSQEVVQVVQSGLNVFYGVVGGPLAFFLAHLLHGRQARRRGKEVERFSLKLALSGVLTGVIGVVALPILAKIPLTVLIAQDPDAYMYLPQLTVMQANQFAMTVSYALWLAVFVWRRQIADLRLSLGAGVATVAALSAVSMLVTVFL